MNEVFIIYNFSESSYKKVFFLPIYSKFLVQAMCQIISAKRSKKVTFA